MTQDEWKKINDALKGAEEDTTPFVVMDEELAVVGDANETQVKPTSYTIHFRVPIEENGKRKMVMKEVTYEDRYITARQDIKIVQLITQLLPYFKKPNADGTVAEYTEEELWHILTDMDQEIYDVMYELVGIFLGVDKALRDFILPGDVLSTVTRILEEYKEVVNESDTFFQDHRPQRS